MNKSALRALTTTRGKLFLILGLTALAYTPSLSAYFISDSFNQIDLARRLTSLELFTVETYRYYRPILLNSYRLDHAVWGVLPAGYRLTSLLLHLLNTYLVWRLVSALRVTPNAALFACLVFAITPVHAPGVVWALARSDLLATTFYLSAFLAIHRHPSSLLVGGLLTACALLTKEIAISLPLMVAVAAFLTASPAEVGQKLRKAVRPSIVPLSLLAVYLVGRTLAFGHFPSSPIHASWSPLRIGLNTARYAVALILPFDLEPLKPFLREYPGLLLVLSMGVAASGSWLLLRVRGNAAVYVCVAWSAIALLPVLRTYGTQYLYLPSVGVAGVLGILLGQLAERSKAYRTVAVVTSVACLIGLWQFHKRMGDASDYARNTVKSIQAQIPAGQRAIVIGLPSELQGMPVFGWPGNLRYALALVGHSVSVQAPGTVRYHDAGDLPTVVVSRDECAVDVSFEGGRNLFRIYDARVISGTLLPAGGSHFTEEMANVIVRSQTATGTPTGLRIQLPEGACHSIPLYLATPAGLRPL